MDLLGFVFLFLSLMSLTWGVVLSSIGKVLGSIYCGMLFFILFLYFLLSGIAFFAISARIFTKRLSEAHFRLSKKISTYAFNSNRDVLFSKTDKTWISDLTKESVGFDLRGCFFKKSFIIAFVTRGLRYPLISYQKPVHQIAKICLRGYKKDSVITISFRNGDRIIRKTIVKNGYSRYGFIPWMFTFLKTPPTRERHKSKSESLGNSVIKIDERIFTSL